MSFPIQRLCKQYNKKIPGKLKTVIPNNARPMRNPFIHSFVRLCITFDSRGIFNVQTTRWRTLRRVCTRPLMFLSITGTGKTKPARATYRLRLVPQHSSPLSVSPNERSDWHRKRHGDCDTCFTTSQASIIIIVIHARWLRSSPVH